MKILVCLDGEPHTRAAIERAIALARREDAEILSLHVVDPWLEQFSSEIYAQGRREYLEWVEACRADEASRAREEFESLCTDGRVRARFKLRHGDPLTEILAELREAEPDLVITGARPLSFWERLRSGNLPQRLNRALAGEIPMLAVEAGADAMRPVSSCPG